MQMAMTNTEPICDPMLSVSAPMTGGIMAPPQIPVTISPEISFAFSGRALSACEKMTENMLEQV